MTVAINMGRLLMTRGINDLVAEDETFAKFVINSLTRHCRGDWGNLTDEDKQENELSLKEGYRLLSAYEAEGLPKIWIITEAGQVSDNYPFPRRVLAIILYFEGLYLP